MVAPPSKTLIKLADGRTIAVASEDAARYEYYSEAGKVMRRAKGLGGAPSPKPATKDPFATDPLEFGRAKVPPVAANCVEDCDCILTLRVALTKSIL